MLYKEDEKVLMVSEDDFYKEIKTSDDVDISNLNKEAVKKALHCNIVMFIGQGSRTSILKNRYGQTGFIVE